MKIEFTPEQWELINETLTSRFVRTDNEVEKEAIVKITSRIATEKAFDEVFNSETSIKS